MAAAHQVAVPVVAARQVVARLLAMVVAEQAAADRVVPMAVARLVAGQPVAVPVVVARRAAAQLVVAQLPATAVAE